MILREQYTLLIILKMNKQEEITAGTRLESMLADLLGEIGFDVEWQVKVGKYTLDLYLREFHLAFEADGPQHLQAWHKRHDEARDKWLEQTMGIPTCRVSQEELKKGKATRKIIQFIDRYADSLMHRRSLAAGYWI